MANVLKSRRLSKVGLDTTGAMPGSDPRSASVGRFFFSPLHMMGVASRFTLPQPEPQQGTSVLLPSVAGRLTPAGRNTVMLCGDF